VLQIFNYLIVLIRNNQHRIPSEIFSTNSLYALYCAFDSARFRLDIQVCNLIKRQSRISRRNRRAGACLYREDTTYFFLSTGREYDIAPYWTTCERVEEHLKSETGDCRCLLAFDLYLVSYVEPLLVANVANPMRARW